MPATITRTRTTSRAWMVLLALTLWSVLFATAAGARVSVSPNWRLETPLRPARGFDAVSLAVDPRNARHIVATDADWVAGLCEFQVSFDGGREWTAGTFKMPPGFMSAPCTVGPHPAEHMQNAAVAFGSRRNVYAVFASARPRPDGSDSGKSLLVARSRDGGRHWGQAVVVTEGGPTPDQGPHYVLPTLTVAPARAGGPRKDRVIVAAAQSVTPPGGRSAQNVVVSISDNGGATWDAPVAANAAGTSALEPSRPVVGRDGAIYVAWREQGRGSSPGTFTPEGFVVMGKSTDGGRTWTQTRTAAVTGYTYSGPPQPPFTTQRSFTASTFPRLAIDPRNDDLYLVYGQGPTTPGGRPGASRKAKAADHFINPDQDVWFQRSTDRGATWSTPKVINTAPVVQTEITQTRHPYVSVAPNGRVDIVWQDRRAWYQGCTNTHVPCEEARLGDTYYAYSRNGGRTFSRNLRISDRSTNNDVGFDYRFGTYWYYGPVAVSTATNRLLVAWMDSRRGNVENDTQDIYLARVNLKARRRVPVRRIRARGTSAFSVALSRMAYPGGPEAVLASTFVTRPWTRLVVVNRGDVGSALTGGFLARANIGSVLAAPAGGLTPAMKREVARMAPIGAYVIGSEKRLSPQVVGDLAAAGVPSDQIVRLSGSDAADTARLVAEAADRRTAEQQQRGDRAYNAAIVLNPGSADAVTTAVLAANRRLPVLFVGRDSVPAATAQALRDLAIDRTLVIGGRKVIDDAVMGQLPSPRRLGGTNAFRTSARVLTEQRLRGVPDNVVYVTNGRSRMRTALLGAAVGRIGGLQLVSPKGAKSARRTVERSRKLRGSVQRLIAFVG